MLPLPVASLVGEFNVGPLTLFRPSAYTQDADGVFVAGAETQITLDPVAAHPVTGKELEQLPEADRTRETMKFYATVALQARDRIDYGGKSYRLINAEDWDRQGENWIGLGQLEDSP